MRGQGSGVQGAPPDNMNEVRVARDRAGGGQARQWRRGRRARRAAGRVVRRSSELRALRARARRRGRRPVRHRAGGRLQPLRVTADPGGSDGPAVRPPMKFPVLLTYRIPSGPARALDAACAVERLDERPVTREQLIARLPGKQALICLLTERIDREVLEAGRDLKVVANDRRGLRQHRRGGGARARHRRHQHAGRADRGDGGVRVGAHPGGGASHPGRGAAAAPRRVDGLGARLHAGHRARRQAARHRRHGADWPRGGRPGARVRHARRLRRGGRPPGAGGGRRHARVARRAAGRLRRRVAARAAHARDAPPDRPPRARAHAPHGHPGEHVARPGRRRGGARLGARRSA